MASGGMDVPGSEPRGDPGTSSSASVTAPPLGTNRVGGTPGARARVAHFLSNARITWVWGAHGLLGVLLGLLLLRQFGDTLGPTSAILGVWVLVCAGTTAWRWHLDSRRSVPLLLTSLIGLVAGILTLVGGGFSTVVIMWIVGLFWVVSGLLELLAWFRRRGPAIQWP